MVSKTLKTKYAIAKTNKAIGTILPIFKKDSPGDFVNELLREDEHLRNYILKNPEYKSLLEKNVIDAFQKYKGILTCSRIVDSWDRVTSSIGGLASATGVFSAGLGEIISQGEDIIEEIPKALYAIYYYNKTGDKTAIPYWIGIELASHTPAVGDFIDMSNIYVNRARKATKKKAKEDFLRMVKTGELEKRIAA